MPTPESLKKIETPPLSCLQTPFIVPPRWRKFLLHCPAGFEKSADCSLWSGANSSNELKGYWFKNQPFFICQEAALRWFL